MQTQICVICEGESFVTLYTVDKKQILKCATCGLVKTGRTKVPSYKAYYRDEEYDQEKALFEKIFLKRYYRIAKYAKVPGKLLDVGSSTGTLLSVFKRHGWSVLGIEPSDKASKIASAKGVETMTGVIEDLDLKGQAFDVVTANHVLEHVENPTNVLKRIFKLLKPGGLVYIDVPNFASFNSMLAGEKWRDLLPDEHLHHFTPATLINLLEKVDFRVVEWGTSTGVFDLANPLAATWQALINRKKRFFYMILSLPISFIQILSKKGDGLYVIGKK